MFKSKLLWKVAIIVLIATLSIAGLTSCGGAATEPTSFSSSGGEDNVGGTPAPEPTPEPVPTPTFPKNTYYKIYAPWVKWDESQAPNGWRTNVSYQDTNTLTQIWKQQIKGGKYNNGARWFIRDANNNQSDPRTGSYYYFDKDFNIVYYRQGRGSLTVRKFLTGIMTKYRVRMGSARNDGTYTIGAVYETLFSKSEINANNYDQLNIFMGHDDMRATKGGLEVLTMNTGYDDRWQNEFGVDFYYNMNVIGENQLGQYTSKNPDDLDKFFNGTRNLSWNIWYVNFRFVFAHPYDWHLTEHINKKGWH